jgi:arylsulfatase A-like enzyme
MKRGGTPLSLLLLSSVVTCSPFRTDGDSSGDANDESEDNASAEETSADMGKNVAVTSTNTSPRTAVGPPNVVVVLLDTLRPDYLEVYGFDHDTAPFLKQMAQSSVVFENAFSASSWTAPSTASIFTGLYPPEHTVVQGFRAHRGMIAELRKEGHAEMEINHMPTGLKTLPEIFKQAGYRTYGLASNINIGNAIGFNRGFDRFKKDVNAPAESLFEKVSEWRDEIVRSQPFFLYLHFNDTHFPYHKRLPFYHPSTDPKSDARSRYRSEISYLDTYLKKIWHLPGIRRNTVLVVLSDHGEEFWEHGGIKHGPTLYVELNHVVMMIHGPSVRLKPMRVAENVSQVDMVPTLAAIIGAKYDVEREGISLLPLMSGDDSAQKQRKRLHDRCLFAHRMLSMTKDVAAWSVTCGPLKLIDWRGERRMLFDHRTDPGEHHDISSERPQTVDQLFERLRTFKKRMSRRERVTATTEVALDEDLLIRLEALGYVEHPTER